MCGVFAFCCSSIYSIVLSSALFALHSLVVSGIWFLLWMVILDGCAYLLFVDFCIMDFSSVVTRLVIALKVANMVVVVADVNGYSPLPYPSCVKVFLNHSVSAFNLIVLALGGKKAIWGAGERWEEVGLGGEGP